MASQAAKSSTICRYLTDTTPSLKPLAIICQGKNDDYMGNFRWRLATSLNSRVRYLKYLKALDQIEIFVCDWDSSEPLYKGLDLEDETRKHTNFLIVPPATAQFYNKGSSFSSSHTLNALVRRSISQYILFCDSDVIVPVDSLAKILKGIREEKFDNFSLKDSFFWASKYHIPNNIVRQNLALEEIEEHISRHWPGYLTETVDTDNFMGCGVGMLLSRQMWLESRGLNEELVHWGWNDVEWHRRLEMKYRWNDLQNFGIKMFHLEHYTQRTNEAVSQTGKIQNPQINSKLFAPNNEDWGLQNESLQIINGFGDTIDPGTRVLQEHKVLA